MVVIVLKLTLLFDSRTDAFEGFSTVRDFWHCICNLRQQRKWVAELVKSPGVIERLDDVRTPSNRQIKKTNGQQNRHAIQLAVSKKKRSEMKNRKIIITHDDYRKLTQLVFSDMASTLAPNSNLADLRNELEQAVVVDCSEVPADVITMNSTVRLRDCKTGEVDTYTLVFPEEANISQDKLSILAPIGTAILGYRVGDEVRWRVPSGWRRVQVGEVLYQPERENAA